MCKLSISDQASFVIDDPPQSNVQVQTNTGVIYHLSFGFNVTRQDCNRIQSWTHCLKQLLLLIAGQPLLGELPSPCAGWC